MQVSCPNCHDRLELPDATTGADITCPACGSTFCLEGQPSTQSYEPLRGQRLGKFELLDTVGVGAFGTVYTDPDTTASPPAYRNRTDYRPGDQIPLVLDGNTVATIPVAELLP